MRDKDIILPIIIGASLLFSATNIYNGNKIDQEALSSFKNNVSASFDDAEKLIIVTPDNPVVVECDCGGTGVITHGDGHKTPCTCMASGKCECAKKSSQLFSNESRNAEIVMYTRPGCLACTQWKQVEVPKLIAAGWKVTEVESLTGLVPRYDIFINGKVTTYDGYMSMSALRKIVNAK